MERARRRAQRPAGGPLDRTLAGTRWSARAHRVAAAHVGRAALPLAPALARHPNSVNGEIDAIVQQFDFGPAGDRRGRGRAARRGTGADHRRDAVGRVPATRRQRDARRSRAPDRRPATAGTTSSSTPSRATSCASSPTRSRQRGRVYEAWGFGAQLGRGRGITALFAGPSGTGKTMAAEILAGELRLDLYRDRPRRRGQQVHRRDREEPAPRVRRGRASGAILLFDEADALFGTRTEVRDSHDRYANLEINYLLQRMEDYAGLAILATNRRAALDERVPAAAALRHRVPVPRRRTTAAASGSACSRAQAARRRRSTWAARPRLELTGGNIRIDRVNAAFLAAADGQPDRDDARACAPRHASTPSSSKPDQRAPSSARGYTVARR